MWNGWGGQQYKRVELPYCPTIFALSHFEYCIEIIEVYNAIKMTINQIS